MRFSAKRTNARPSIAARSTPKENPAFRASKGSAAGEVPARGRTANSKPSPGGATDSAAPAAALGDFEASEASRIFSRKRSAARGHAADGRAGAFNSRNPIQAGHA